MLTDRSCDNLVDMKIASLLPSATEIVCALGLKESLVGITHECDFPEDISDRPHLTSSRISHETMTSLEIDHAVRSQLDGHGTIYDLDTALLERLSPDLIITQELCDVCAVNYKIVNQAARTYTAEATVISLEPNSIEDIFDTIVTVGELAGVRKRADDLVADLVGRLGAIWQKIEFLGHRPKVMMLEWLEPPFAPGHWVPEQVEKAGGHCVLGQAGSRSVTTTYQAIAESNPEVLVLVPCGYYIADTMRQLENTYFPIEWKEMEAIKRGEVWAIDATSYFSRPGPRIIDGVEILAKVFHPSMFGFPAPEEAIRIERGLLNFPE
ncbi:cobalamin-binding protein [Leptolyngbya sp. 7M]|uniref:cobalamin-binding protein n=1 Tax=Leptolyngbya sp. 7M TaxID=2812896 RepID=UPI001B8B14DD|nr:cobalamin-binding protein [Leptolyngbya sp. 7M]QYO66477.1 cobalamin-binding protein [Leptolyngbya sp. 7M]